MIYKECYDMDNLQIEIYTPDCPGQVIYFFSPTDELDFPYDLLDERNAACVSITGMDWNKDLTPWKAPGLKPGDPDFGGEADAFLKKLFFEIVPQAEESIELMVDVEPDWTKHRYTAGISLGGLFAVYSLFRTDLFKKAAGISASLWYDDFISFTEKYQIYQEVDQVYLLLGEKEKQSKDPRMCQVEEKTNELKEILLKKGVSCEQEIVSGGHFADAEERIAKAFAAILQEI